MIAYFPLSDKARAQNCPFPTTFTKSRITLVFQLNTILLMMEPVIVAVGVVALELVAMC